MTLPTELIPAYFAELLTTAADEYGAPIFAADLAIGGANPEHVEMMANRWASIPAMEPPGFADELRSFAGELRAERSAGPDPELETPDPDIERPA